MKAAIYCRVSTEDQGREGTSLESQQEACIEKAQNLGYIISKEFIFRETFSGLTLERGQLSILRRKANDHEFEAIVVHTPDRLARKGEDILTLAKEFKTIGIKLLFVKEQWEDTLNGKLVAFVLGWASEFEVAQIRERTARGRKMRIERGQLPTGRGFLYGYDYQNGRNIANNFLDNVRMVGMWLLHDQVSLTEICRRLMSKGIPAPKGGMAWGRSTLSRILRNPAYAGREYAAKTVTKDGRRVNNPASEFIEISSCVDKTAFTWDEFQSIQRQLKRNAELSRRNQKLNYLLAGYIYCALCGQRFTGTPVHGKPYYRCSSHNNPLRQYCHNRTIKAGMIEANVWAEISKVLKQPELILKELYRKKESGTDTAGLEQQLEHNIKRLKSLEESETRYLRLYGFGNYTMEKFDQEYKRIERERSLINQENEVIEKRIAETRELLSDINKVEIMCNLVVENIESLSFTDKRLVLEALKVRVWINPENIKLEGILPVTEANIAFQQA